MAKEHITELAAELEKCGKVLLEIAEAIRTGQPPKKKVQEVAKKELTLEDVRKVAADKSRQGFTEEVRKLIQKYGAKKLSEVDHGRYGDFMKELEEIGHAG